jgi:hypothetical protein
MVVDFSIGKSYMRKPEDKTEPGQILPSRSTSTGGKETIELASANTLHANALQEKLLHQAHQAMHNRPAERAG